MQTLYDWVLEWHESTVPELHWHDTAEALEACVQSAGDVLYVPCGTFLATKVLEGSLIYGVRKSRVSASPESENALQSAVRLYTKTGKETTRLKQVLGALETHMASLDTKTVA